MNPRTIAKVPEVEPKVERAVLVDLLRRAHFELAYHWRSGSRAVAEEMRDTLGPDPEAWR